MIEFSQAKLRYDIQHTIFVFSNKLQTDFQIKKRFDFSTHDMMMTVIGWDN